MAAFLVDEDLPRSLAPALAEAGFDAASVTGSELRGASDETILRRALEQGRVLITKDLGFGSKYLQHRAVHPGLVLVRIPNDVPAARLIEVVVDAVLSLAEERLDGTLAVVEPGRLRLRRAWEDPIVMAAPFSHETLWRTTRMSLVRRAADRVPSAGRDEAWHVLVETYRRPITRCLRQRVGRHPDGDAIIDEFFGYLFTKDVLSAMDPAEGRFRAFLQGVMRRYVLGKLREHRESGSDAALEGLLVVDLPPNAEVEEEWAWARSLLDRAVEQLLEAIPRDGKFLLQVNGIHPYALTDPAEIAQARGLSLNAVHKALSRARKELERRLLSQIAQLADGEEDYEAEKQALLGRLKQARPGLLD